MQVPLSYISSFVLTFFEHFVCLDFFIIFWAVFKVSSGVFLHNRVATLLSKGHCCASFVVNLKDPCEYSWDI